MHLSSATATSANSEHGAHPQPSTWRHCLCSAPGEPPALPETPRELCPYRCCGQDRHQALCSWCLETPLRSCSPHGDVSASTPPRTRSSPPHKAARDSQEKTDLHPQPWPALPSGLAQGMPAPPPGQLQGFKAMRLAALLAPHSSCREGHWGPSALTRPSAQDPACVWSHHL